MVLVGREMRADATIACTWCVLNKGGGVGGTEVRAGTCRQPLSRITGADALKRQGTVWAALRLKKRSAMLAVALDCAAVPSLSGGGWKQ